MPLFPPEPAIEQAAGLEWWLGNAQGGWASASALGALTRKYHALLAIAHPGMEQRRILLGKLEDTAVAGGVEYPLSTNYYPDAVHPQGFRLMERFLFDGAAARWTYGVAGRRLAKEVWCDRARPATYIRYTLLEGDPLGLQAAPLVSGRSAHSVGLPDFMRRSPGGSVRGGEVRYFNPIPWGIQASAGMFRPKPDFYYNMRYPREEEREEPAQEDWACPGRFEFMLREGQQATLRAWAAQTQQTEEQAARAREQTDAQKTIPQTRQQEAQARSMRKMNMASRWAEEKDAMIEEKIPAAGAASSMPRMIEAGPALDSLSDPEEASRRLSRIVDDFRAYNAWGEIPMLENLLRASDAFFIREGEHFNILAGYPYFGVWARDALISVPGMCCYTGRHALGRDILLNWAKRLRGGLLPNHYDETGRPVFESADGTMWLFWALGQLESEGGMTPEFLRQMWPMLNGALEAWMEGTRFTSLEKDGLVSLKGERLTWMDAARKEETDSSPSLRAITPRAGKRVEINALWIHALSCGEEWAADLGEQKAAQRFSESCAAAREGFVQFYHESGHYLYDGIGPNDAAIRPNQLWAVAIPAVRLSPIAARRALGTLIHTLFAPNIGVRSLSCMDADYHARFGGDSRSRDEAYHRGAVWPWLSGVWTEAWLRCYPKRAEELHRQLMAIAAPRQPGTLLGVAEVRDPASGADGGCPTQAWSVAELLRAAVLVERTRRWHGASAILSPSLEEIMAPMRPKKE